MGDAASTEARRFWTRGGNAAGHSPGPGQSSPSLSGSVLVDLLPELWAVVGPTLLVPPVGLPGLPCAMRGWFSLKRESALISHHSTLSSQVAAPAPQGKGATGVRTSHTKGEKRHRVLARCPDQLSTAAQLSCPGSSRPARAVPCGSGEASAAPSHGPPWRGAQRATGGCGSQSGQVCQVGVGHRERTKPFLLTCCLPRCTAMPAGPTPRRLPFSCPANPSPLSLHLRHAGGRRPTLPPPPPCPAIAPGSWLRACPSARHGSRTPLS